MSARNHRLSALTRWLLALYLAALVFLSLNPWLRPSSAPAVGFLTWDKLDHALAYALLTVILILALRRCAFAVAALLSMAIGIGLEFGQAWLTETRSFSQFDAYANGFGAALGAVGLGFQRLSGLVRRYPERPGDRKAGINRLR